MELTYRMVEYGNLQQNDDDDGDDDEWTHNILKCLSECSTKGWQCLGAVCLRAPQQVDFAWLIQLAQANSLTLTE